jgi:hypothetical protein
MCVGSLTVLVTSLWDFLLILKLSVLNFVALFVNG